ncbi:obscurin-like isoform X2 [Astatotilapia calliptera]|uniref:obscurin-like isoform X2 n=1 Tax=Astatotilapia calliptera TaxID=8154 RepID=UPI000E4008E3|nr:obscurin-like isoform X2 [Astatotilapia calliptera]
MKRSLLCMLELFLLSTLFDVNAEDKPRATLTAGTTIIPVGGSVTLTCSVQSSDGWKYEWFRRTQRTSEGQIRDQQNRDIRVSQGGIYRCRGTRGNPVYYTDRSDDVTIEITFSNKVVVKQRPNWPQIFRGETITLTCEVQEGGETTEWEYKWRGPRTPTQWTHNNDVTFSVSESSSEDYMCKSRRRDDSYSSTEWSESITLSASNKPRATVTAGTTIIPVGGSVTLTCSVQSSDGWKYEWFRRTQRPYEVQIRDQQNRDIRVSEGGIYSCRGTRGNPDYYTDKSDDATIEKTISSKVVVKQQPNWPQIFSGETITLTCEVQEGGETTEWEYKWRGPRTPTQWTHNNDVTFSVSESSSEDYMCKSRRRDDSYSSTEWSEAFTLSVSNKPRATVTAGTTIIPVGGSVTLTCSVQSSDGWKYEWFRRTQRPYEVQIRDQQNRDIRVSEGGIYRCRGTRGNPVYYTDISDDVTIEKTISNKVVVKQRPNWPQIFSGETITLTCEVQEGGETTEWEYKWRGPRTPTQWTHYNGWIFSVSESSSEDYMCKSRRRDDSYSSTEWSESITLSVSNKPRATLTAGTTIIPVGGSVTLTCSVQSSDGWKYEWFRRIQRTSEGQIRGQQNRDIRVSEGGIYSCRGTRGNPVYYTDRSDDVTIEITFSSKVVVKQRPNWPQIFSGETITLTCEVQEGGETTEWEYKWRGPRTPTQWTHYSGWIFSVSESSSEDYMCKSRRRDDSYSSTEWSESITLSVSNKPRATLTAGTTIIPVGGSVTLTCTVQSSDGWKYEWFRRTQRTYEGQIRGQQNRDIRVSQGGIYRCRGTRGNPVYYTDISYDVTIEITFSNKVVVKQRPNWPQIFRGETITLTCEVQEGGKTTEWEYKWRGPRTLTQWTHNNDVTFSVSESSSGDYMCKSRRRDDSYSSTEWSESFTLSVSSLNKPTVTLQPSWIQIYSGETVTVRCEIQGGEGAQWRYEWRTAKLNTPPTSNEYRIIRTTESDSGGYSCRGRRDNFFSEWSDTITLTVSYKARPVLTVSPSWLSPGASVTLNCEVEHPSAGWHIYWYKAVPDLSEKSSSYELLPDGNRTANNSYIIHGQTHTAGYACRAGRGDPEYHTDHSQPKFVWSADVHSAASLTVSPDRVQHFTSDSVSLTCEGKFAEWRVRKFSEDGRLYSDCRRMTGSTCNINTSKSDIAVYWCESGSGEFSSAVNITVHDDGNGPILVSPVHPVTEGASVSLSCSLRTQKILSNVFFYHNDKLIENDPRGELKISAVSKSDEGFYKCQYSGRESAQSWMSVKGVLCPESSSLPVWLIVGLACGISVFIIVLLSFYHFRKKKDSGFISPMTTTNHVVNQSEIHKHNCLDHGAGEIHDVTYSVIQLKHVGKKRKRHKSQEHTIYSEVKVGVEEKSSPAASNEELYSEVRLESSLEDIPTYAEINRHNKAKAKENQEDSPTYAQVNRHNKRASKNNQRH